MRLRFWQIFNNRPGSDIRMRNPSCAPLSWDIILEAADIVIFIDLKIGMAQVVNDGNGTSAFSHQAVIQCGTGAFTSNSTWDYMLCTLSRDQDTGYLLLRDEVPATFGILQETTMVSYRVIYQRNFLKVGDLTSPNRTISFLLISNEFSKVLHQTQTQRQTQTTFTINHEKLLSAEPSSQHAMAKLHQIFSACLMMLSNPRLRSLRSRMKLTDQRIKVENQWSE